MCLCVYAICTHVGAMYTYTLPETKEACCVSCCISLALLLWERVSHWTWSWAGSQQAQRSSCLLLPAAAGVTGTCAAIPGFYIGAERLNSRLLTCKIFLSTEPFSLPHTQKVLYQMLSWSHCGKSPCMICKSVRFPTTLKNDQDMVL